MADRGRDGQTYAGAEAPRAHRSSRSKRLARGHSGWWHAPRHVRPGGSTRCARGGHRRDNRGSSRRAVTRGRERRPGRIHVCPDCGQRRRKRTPRTSGYDLGRDRLCSGWGRGVSSPRRRPPRGVPTRLPSPTLRLLLSAPERVPAATTISARPARSVIPPDGRTHAQGLASAARRYASVRKTQIDRRSVRGGGNRATPATSRPRSPRELCAGARPVRHARTRARRRLDVRAEIWHKRPSHTHRGQNSPRSDP